MDVDRVKRAAKEWSEANFKRVMEDTRFHIETLEVAFIAGYGAGHAAGYADATRRKTPQEEPCAGA